MSRSSASRAAFLLSLPRADCRKALAAMSERQQHALRHHWRLWAHAGQLPPEGDWLGWLILAGRGFGKTRAGAEWVRARAEVDPEARIALVGASLGEVRSVMVEGESGLLAIAPHGQKPKFEPSKRQLQWPGGGRAMLYSAGEAESLRGPQHSHACRADPERGLSQRDGRPPRCPAVPGNRRRSHQSADSGRGWAILAGRSSRNRGMGRRKRANCGATGRQLAVRDAG